MDAITRQIIAFHVGDRSRDSAKALWANVPLVYREQATFHTDQYDAYTGVIPAERHRAITKKARKTKMNAPHSKLRGIKTQNPKPSKQLHLDLLTMELLIRLFAAL